MSREKFGIDLGTERPTDGIVRLARFGPADAPVMCEGDRDSELRRRFEFPDRFVPTERHSLEVIAGWEQDWLAGTRFPFAVRDAGTNALLGGCELQPRASASANLSFWTYPAHRGRGVASRAVALACSVAFAGLGVRRVEILADPDNAASCRVAIRNGFRVLGTHDGRVLHVLEAAR